MVVMAAMGVAAPMMMVVVVVVIMAMAMVMVMVVVIMGVLAFPIALAVMMGVVIMGGVIVAGLKLGGHGRPRNCEADHPSYHARDEVTGAARMR